MSNCMCNVNRRPIDLTTLTIVTADHAYTGIATY